MEVSRVRYMRAGGIAHVVSIKTIVHVANIYTIAYSKFFHAQHLPL